MKNFIKFLSLSELFKKPLSEQELKKLEIQKQADQLIENGVYDLFFDLVKNGYQITPLQLQTLSEKFTHYVYNNNSKKANEMVMHGYEITSNDFVFLMCNKNFYDHCVDRILEKRQVFNDNHKNFHFSSIALTVAQKLSDSTYTDALFKEWKDICIHYSTPNGHHNTYVERFRVENLYRNFKDIWFKDISISDYQNVLQVIKRCNDISGFSGNINQYIAAAQKNVIAFYNIYNDMTSMLGVIFKREHMQLVEQTKHVYLDEHINNIVVNSTMKQSQEYHIKNLPGQAQHFIHEIEKNYNRINNNSDKVSQEDIFIIKKMMDERLPEILRKYFSIDSEYRTTLKNHEGKNAGDLLLDSLSELHEMMQDKVVSINEDKLTNLTVDNRYMKAVRKV